MAKRKVHVTPMPTAADFVREHYGKPCFVQCADTGRRYGTVNGLSVYGTVIVQFEAPSVFNSVGRAQEWPVESVHLV